MKTLFIGLCLSLMPAALSAEVVGRIAGLHEGTIPAPHHGRDMEFAVWYPAVDGSATAPFAGNPVFQPVTVAPDAEVMAGRYPLVLLSHGLGGHYRSLGWLAVALAERGAVVVAVNHPESTVFDFDMQAGLRHWTRAEDLRLVLDHVLVDARLGPMVDEGRIAAAGFSYGGWTALSLGGVRGNLAGYRAHCETAPTGHCRDITARGGDLGLLDDALWNADMAEARVTAVVAIDPGLTWGLEAADVAGLTVPTLLIQLGAGEDRLDSTDISAEGSGFAGLVPEAQMVEVAPAYHFSALPLCTEKGAMILESEKDDPVCTDPEGADRAVIHDAVIAAFSQHLGL
jgi:predicted dienelactone hydrolase